MPTEAPCKRRRYLRAILAVLIVIVVVVVTFGWLIRGRVGVQPDGVRITFGPQPPTQITEKEPINLAAELVAEGISINRQRIRVQRGRPLIFFRERWTLPIMFTAGKQGTDTSRLEYALFDADGAELSRGILQPAVVIDPGRSATVEIVDAQLAVAQRIEIRKLP